MELIHFLLGIFVCTSGLFVFLTENPVHSVLFLILTFFNSSAILLLLNADFLALIFVIVYVFAISYFCYFQKYIQECQIMNFRKNTIF